MDSVVFKDLLMFLVAAYGAGLSTYIFVTNKPQYDLIYNMTIFAAPSSKQGIRFAPRDFVSITVVNTGRVPIYVGKYGFVDESGKFLSVEMVNPSIVRGNRSVQVRLEDEDISEFAPTNEHIPLIVDDREVKPHATSIAFFPAEALLSAIRKSGAKKVSMCVECGKTRKVKEIDEAELSKLKWIERSGRQG